MMGQFSGELIFVGAYIGGYMYIVCVSKWVGLDLTMNPSYFPLCQKQG